MYLSAPLQRIRPLALLLAAGLWLTTACQDHQPPTPTDATPYPADVVRSWLSLQLNVNLGLPQNQPLIARRFAYTGIALYESVAPGLPGYQSIAPQLNGLPALPTIVPNVRYHWPACANAALAAMHRYLYPTVSAASKAAIDSLENAQTALFRKERPDEELKRSADFGKQIAAAVFEWSKTDGSDNTAPYTPPTGAGLWVPTAPTFAAAVLPHYGKCRLLVSGSDTGVDPGAPLAYSEDPASAYYAQAKDLYEVSQTLTDEQRTIALFWPDNAWFNVLSQVLAREKPGLGVAALAFAQLGIAMSDAAVNLFKLKYQYNAVRPITYIRTVMGQPGWNTLIASPGHPEFPSGHSVMSAAAAQTLTLLFGENYAYTDTPYNLPGFKPRSFHSFADAALEAAQSRMYAGIHYRKTCEVSLKQGEAIARNVAGKLTFKK